MSKCLLCANIDLRAYPRHALIGYAHCKFSDSGSFYSFSKPSCEKFKQVNEEAQTKRIAFDKQVDRNQGKRR